VNKKLVLALSTILISLANADQGSFTNSGGSTSASSTAVIITSNVTSPAGTLTLNCPRDFRDFLYQLHLQRRELCFFLCGRQQQY
jgi:hypothetical protein